MSAFHRHALVSTVAFGLLSWMAWPANGIAPLLFIGWIPLLYLESLVSDTGRSNKVLFGYSYLAFFIWNVLTTWWVYNSSGFGVTAAVLCNSLFMSLVFLLFHITKKRTGDVLGYCSLPAYWISFEYIHMCWDISWPWLTLGNGFASFYKYIQWYEYSGILGGSLWILVINFLIFKLIFKSRPEDRRPQVYLITASIVLPVLFSCWMYTSYHEKSQPVNIAVVQPNIDPYNEKFSGNDNEQLAKILRLSATVIDSTTDFLVAPETALPAGLWEEEIKENTQVQTIRKFLNGFPELTIVIGASTFRQYKENGPRSATARKFGKGEGYYDSYNTALQVDNFMDNILLYHKSKLVPGVEKMPYPSVFGFLEKFAIDLGGMSGSLGTEAEAKIFTSHDSIGIAPIICYESVYGDYTSEFIKKGAQLIFIITNDGWWGNTPGHRQHLVYGRLRAIEMRRSIARSANTGISCFINQRGDIMQPTKYWEDDAIKQTINANDKITFYAAHGDYVAKAALIFSVALLMITLIKRKRG